MFVPRSFKIIALLPLLMLGLQGCGGDDNQNEDLADATAFKSNAPYSNSLAGCARATSSNDYCTLETLPLLGMEVDTPTVSDVMDRVVVSHDWMGTRFEELLQEMPAQILPLFKAVTAIVIDADIRPAYYTSGTGAIYLDPAYLWLSLDEKATINKKQDYRAGFDDPLAFRQIQRYLKNGAPAYVFGSLSDDSTRELEDIVLLISRLLLHELAHANDFIPPGSYASLNRQNTVDQAATSLSDTWVSTRLSDTTPLRSDTMFSLADVMYRGMTPNIADLEILAVEVGEAFEPDGAGDDYGYTSQYEDVAMLFETAMMKYLYDADYELAFTDVPEDPQYCQFYIIGWGVHNRVGDSNVKARAQFVVSELLPSLNTDMFFQELEPPQDISGDWCLTPASAFGSQKPTLKRIHSEDRLRPYL